MEIEELKDIWRKQSEAFTPKDETELANMLKGKSTSIIARLKRSVWFELIFTFVAGLALLGYALTLPVGWLKWTSISIVVLFCLYTFYYFKKLTMLNRFDANDNLKVSLSRLIANLKSYLRFYKRSYAVLYPVFFFLGLFFTALEQGKEHFINRVTRTDTLIYLVVFAVVFFFASTSLTRWYLKKLYGNHLDNLQAVLRELGQSDDAQS